MLKRPWFTFLILLAPTILVVAFLRLGAKFSVTETIGILLIVFGTVMLACTISPATFGATPPRDLYEKLKWYRLALQGFFPNGSHKGKGWAAPLQTNIVAFWAGLLFFLAGTLLSLIAK